MGILSSVSQKRPRTRRPLSTIRSGVIDIGSNSVRLVIYSVHGRSVVPHYNEKVMAGLGRGLGEYGRLDPAGVEAAVSAIRRFRAIADGLGEVPLDAFATAAVRTADDGADFIARIKDETGLTVDVLSGADEARGSAIGVLAGLKDVDGVVGDLGGSSLELIHAGNMTTGEGETHLVGPLALGSGSSAFEDARIRAEVRKTLSGSSVLSNSGGTFYAVGGSWRAFAGIHMEMTDYPLRLLQGYRMTSKEVRRLAKRLCNPSDSVQEIAQRVSSRRVALMPYAAVVLDEVFRVGKFEQLVTSAYGLREGRVLGPSREKLKRGQTLLDGLEVVSRLQPVQLEFTEALFDFVWPVVSTLPNVFSAEGDDELLTRAACRTADIGATLHPDYRAQLAFDLVLHGPHAGCEHAERTFLALAAGARYSRSFKASSSVLRLMSDEQADRARQLGALMRLGAVYSGRTAATLSQASLEIEPGFLVLRVPARLKDMNSDFVKRRLQQAASALGVESRVEEV